MEEALMTMLIWNARDATTLLEAARAQGQFAKLRDVEFLDHTHAQKGRYVALCWTAKKDGRDEQFCLASVRPFAAQVAIMMLEMAERSRAEHEDAKPPRHPKKG